MSLSEIIAGVADHEKTLTVLNPADSEVVADLRAHLGERNVRVVAEATASATPRNIAVLTRDGTFLTAAGLDDLPALLGGPPVETGSAGGDVSTDADGPIETPSTRPILDFLDEELFASHDRRTMLAATEEIEDRAWRVGDGSLHAGFQRFSNLVPRIPAYERLAERLDVHAYATPDGPVPDHEGFALHIERSSEIESTWFVVFDGAGEDASKCALVAEERDGGEPEGGREESGFYGFWTYDPVTVDWILDHLRETYGLVEPP
jgi:hypothetical protein